MCCMSYRGFVEGLEGFVAELGVAFVHQKADFSEVFNESFDFFTWHFSAKALVEFVAELVDGACAVDHAEYHVGRYGDGYVVFHELHRVAQDDELFPFGFDGDGFEGAKGWYFIHVAAFLNAVVVWGIQPDFYNINVSRS